MARGKTETRANGGANLGFEATLWAAADKMRNNMDAAEYKHVVLGLMFLKYISDAFEEQHAKLAAEKDANPEAEPHHREARRHDDVFVANRPVHPLDRRERLPVEARWSFLKAKAKQPTIGKFIDDAMIAIERDNPVLKHTLPKDFARQGLDKQRLGELVVRSARFMESHRITQTEWLQSAPMEATG